MGPPEFTGGNAGRVHAVMLTRRMLQWGRRNSPAETPGRSGPWFARPVRFNGAAGIHRRKRSGSCWCPPAMR